MQQEMLRMQEEIENKTYSATAGGGMVKVVLSGKFEMKKINLDKSIVDADDVEVLEDLIVAAYNDAKEKADVKMGEAMGSITGGLNLGGMKLPF